MERTQRMLLFSVSRAIHPGKKWVDIKLFGRPFLIQERYAHDLIDQIIVKDQYRVELVRGTVVDAGANVGIFSVFAALTHPNEIIYAFEPTPSTFNILKENTKYYPNIKCFNCGLGEIEKDATIVAHKKGCGSNYIGDGGTPVKIKTIDSFDLPMGFLKMDTEGYEGNILMGAAKTIKKNKPIIAMSAYHHPEDKIELPKLLNSIAPYDCELRNDCEEDFICRPR